MNVPLGKDLWHHPDWISSRDDTNGTLLAHRGSSEKGLQLKARWRLSGERFSTIAV